LIDQILLDPDCARQEIFEEHLGKNRLVAKGTNDRVLLDLHDLALHQRRRGRDAFWLFGQASFTAKFVPPQDNYVAVPDDIGARDIVIMKSEHLILQMGDTFVKRYTCTEREHEQCDDEAPEVQLPTIAERMIGIRTLGSAFHAVEEQKFVDSIDKGMYALTEHCGAGCDPRSRKFYERDRQICRKRNVDHFFGGNPWRHRSLRRLWRESLMTPTTPRRNRLCA
jgi:hypothetical protein